MSATELQAFLFRSLAINQGVSVGQGDGALPGRGKRTSTIEAFSAAAQEHARFMGAVYELLYCLENSIRELVESTLREAHGDERWWSIGVPDRIRRSAEARRNDDIKARWHGPRGSSLLSYIDFPQYADIIAGQWSLFEPLLGDSDWVTHYFAEMNRSRRALAHTGQLSSADVERMELRVRDWLRVVG